MEILRQLQHQLPPFVFDVVRLCIWLLLLTGIFVPLERTFARRRQKVFRAGWRTDLGYYFLNSLLPKMLLVLPISLLAIAIHQLLPSAMYAWQASMPLWLRFSAALIVGEFGAYWGHRWMHELPVLWRFHALHHSAQEMDWLVNTRAHPLDMVFTRSCGLLPIYLLGLAQATSEAMDPMLLLYAVVATVWSFFIHANLRWRLGWLEYLISTPAFHHWHHTKDGPAYVNKNYAAIFPWVDKIFGTFYLPGRQWPASYGIDSATDPGILRQLLQPFAQGTNSRPGLGAPAVQERTPK